MGNIFSWDFQVQTKSGVYGTLGDGVHAEVSILCVSPGAFEAFETFDSSGIFVNALISYRASKGEVMMAFVMHDSIDLWVIKRGIPDIRSSDTEVLIEKELDLTGFGSEIVDFNFPNVTRQVGMDSILSCEPYGEAWVRMNGVSDESIMGISQMMFPVGVVKPTEMTVDPYAHLDGVVHKVIVESYMRVKKITDDVAIVKTDEQVTISENKWAWQFSIFLLEKLQFTLYHRYSRRLEASF
jgi:hypothetical protein